MKGPGTEAHLPPTVPNEEARRRADAGWQKRLDLGNLRVNIGVKHSSSCPPAMRTNRTENSGRVLAKVQNRKKAKIFMYQPKSQTVDKMPSRLLTANRFQVFILALQPPYGLPANIGGRKGCDS